MNRNTFIPISTLLTLLIVAIQASDALSRDTSFSSDGRVTTSFSAADDVGSGIAVQFDDKIVVVGTSDNGSGISEFAVARYNVDGSLDTNFNVDGRVTTFFSAADDVGSGLAVQLDDKIVVVGTSDSGSGVSEFAVARFNVDGSLDTSFSDDGMVTTSFSAGNDIGSGIAIQS
ncbi:MAG: delta-60 repeat domain-containing protein, partial [Desulfobacterales bacterium]